MSPMARRVSIRPSSVDKGGWNGERLKLDAPACSSSATITCSSTTAHSHGRTQAADVSCDSTDKEEEEE